MVKHFSRSFILGLSPITWNASMPRSACREAVRQVIWASRGAIDFVDARSAPLDPQICALKLEHGLCEGRACG